MQHANGHFTAHDGTSIYTESWQPNNDAKAVIIICHGVAEHVGRYAHLGSFFAEHGYAVFGYDQRGHGRSSGRRGYFETLHHPLSDFAIYLTQIRTQHTELPIFVFGHSMGSVIPLAYVLEDDTNPIQGIITTGTALAADQNLSDIAVRLLRFFNHIAPTLPILSVDITAMSRDPVVVATWTADPLVNLTLLRVRTTLVILGAIRHIRANLSEINVPIMILHGEGDRIVPPEGSVILYEGISSEDKSLRLYPDLYHELINEPERNMILDDMIKWLEQYIS